MSEDVPKFFMGGPIYAVDLLNTQENPRYSGKINARIPVTSYWLSCAARTCTATFF